MPTRPRPGCAYMRCSKLAEPGSAYCAEHTRKVDRQRGTAQERGYDYRWLKIRNNFLMRHPLCYDCIKAGRVTAATEVHHIIPLDRNGTNDEGNLMSLCHSCHVKRTEKN